MQGNCKNDVSEDMKTQRIGAGKLQNFIDTSLSDILLRFVNAFQRFVKPYIDYFYDNDCLVNMGHPLRRTQHQSCELPGSSANIPFQKLNQRGLRAGNEAGYTILKASEW